MLEKKCKSLCLPVILTGIFKKLLSNCATIYQKAILEFIDENEEDMEGKAIILCKEINFNSSIDYKSA